MLGFFPNSQTPISNSAGLPPILKAFSARSVSGARARFTLPASTAALAAKPLAMGLVKSAPAGTTSLAAQSTAASMSKPGGGLAFFALSTRSISAARAASSVLPVGVLSVRVTAMSKAAANMASDMAFVAGRVLAGARVAAGMTSTTALASKPLAMSLVLTTPTSKTALTAKSTAASRVLPGGGLAFFALSTRSIAASAARSLSTRGAALYVKALSAATVRSTAGGTTSLQAKSTAMSRVLARLGFPFLAHTKLKGSKTTTNLSGQKVTQINLSGGVDKTDPGE